MKEEGNAIMKIEEFYNSKIMNISYEKGSAKTVSDFYDNFIKHRLPDKKVLEKWHKLIVDYVNSHSAIYFIRKYESNGKKGSWNTRRGCVVRFSNAELVYSKPYCCLDINHIFSQSLYLLYFLVFGFQSCF